MSPSCSLKGRSLMGQQVLEWALQLSSPGPLAFPRGRVAVAALVGSFALGDIAASGEHLCGRLEEEVPRDLRAWLGWVQVTAGLLGEL